MNPSTEPFSLRTVALIDPLSGGHHGSYAVTLARELLGRGLRVHLIGPAPLIEEVCGAVPQVTGHVLALFPGDAAGYYRLGRPARERLNLRFVRAALRLAAGVGAGTTHLLWLDSFMLPLLLARLEWLVRRSGPRTPVLRATLHWAYFLRTFRKDGGRLSETVHRLLLRALSMSGVRVMMHSRRLIGTVGAGALDLVPHPALPPQTPAQQRASVRQAVREDLGIPAEAVVLLAFGGTRHDKGSDLALEALALLPGQYHLLVVGPARTFDADALYQAGQRLGLMDRLHLRLDYVPDHAVEGYFLASDAALLPYRRVFAGQSGPLMIAAALGVPVLAADVAVLTEMVEGYRLGHLFAPEDPVALARCVTAFDPAALTPDTARFQRDHTPEAFADAVLRSYQGASSAASQALALSATDWSAGGNHLDPGPPVLANDSARSRS